ncbi:MAG: hypothetical protein IJ557_02650 [Bacteroidaceae bacterium]|nr:hypothetical protein [Bacteroidaceae bacterium]
MTKKKTFISDEIVTEARENLTPTKHSYTEEELDQTEELLLADFDKEQQAKSVDVHSSSGPEPARTPDYQPLPSELKSRVNRLLVKQVWIDDEVNTWVFREQLSRKMHRRPSSFDAIAYDALVEYLNKWKTDK